MFPGGGGGGEFIKWAGMDVPHECCAGAQENAQWCRLERAESHPENRAGVPGVIQAQHMANCSQVWSIVAMRPCGNDPTKGCWRRLTQN